MNKAGTCATRSELSSDTDSSMPWMFHAAEVSGAFKLLAY